MRACVGLKPVPVRWSDANVRFDAMPGEELTITYPLINLTHRVRGLWKDSAPNLQMTFRWRGNMVTSSDPATSLTTSLTTLFLPKPRLLPTAPSLD